MVFGEIERNSCREWASDELSRVFLPVTIDVDVEAFFRDIVSSLSLTVMVVSNDLNPIVSQAVL